MTVETAEKISELDKTLPLGTDPILEGDDHIRLMKEVLDNSVASDGDLVIHFTTRAVAVASTNLAQGKLIRTEGLALVSDQGGAFYRVVPAGTGVVDGVNYIDLVGSDGQLELVPDGAAAVVKQTPVRNAVLNQEAVSQTEATRTGMETLLGTTASGITGATGLLTWSKDRNNAESHRLSTTLMGDNYLQTDTTAAQLPTIPAVDANDVTWQWRLDQAASGVTNRNKAYSAQYNVGLGVQAAIITGDGAADHEVPHFLGNLEGRNWICRVKNLSAVGDWTVASSLFDSASGEYLVQNTTAALATLAALGIRVTDDAIILSESALINGSGNSIYIELMADVEGVSKFGKYPGIEAAGNYVDCGFKVGWLKAKNLTTGATNWVVQDQARGDNWLYDNGSDAEAGTAVIDFVETGFVLNEVGGTWTNALNDEYLFLAFADSGSGSTTYSYPLTDDQLAVNNDTLLSFANGFNAQGQVDTQELTAGSTVVNLGATHENKHYWMYKDKAGSYAFSEYRPLEGITRDDADKWGEVSPVDVSLRTTAKHFDYESATGVVSASSDAGAGNLAWGAFDKNAEPYTVFDWASASQTITAGVLTTPQTLQYKQDEPRTPKSMRIRERTAAGANQSIKRFVPRGSNDGLNWVELDTTYKSGAGVDYGTGGGSLWGALVDLSAITTAYRYLDIYITENWGSTSNVGCAELEFNTILPSDYYLVNEGVMYDSTDTPIERIYLAEVRTGGTGDVTYLRNLPVAKFKAGDMEIQNDLTVHGEIANRGICTAWVNFDGTQNPPLIRDSFNVSDVVDLGIGHYLPVPEGLIPPYSYTIQAISGVSNSVLIAVVDVGAGGLEFYTSNWDGGGANSAVVSDQEEVVATFFGGKDTKGGQ